MADKTYIADDIRRVAAFFQSLNTVADMLTEIGSLENAKAEAGRAMIQANTYRDAALDELDKAKTLAIKIQAQNKQDLSNCKAQVDAVKVEAQYQYQAIVAKAKDDAAAVVKKAEADAQEMTQSYSEQINTLTVTKGDLTSQVNALNDVISQAHADADVAEARLAAVKASIAQLAAT